jgi:hypothetical protein
VDLPSLGAEVARSFGIEEKTLRSGARDATTSAARRKLVRRAVDGRGAKPIEVSRYLNVHPASITGHLRALRRTTGTGRKLRS